MHDPAYRMQVATQNVGYNQPANVSYYFPDGAPTPDIKLVKYDSTQVSALVADTTRPVITGAIDMQLAVDEACLLYAPDFSQIVTITDKKYSTLYINQIPKAGTLLGGIGDSAQVMLCSADNFGNISDTVWFSVTGADLTPPRITKAFADHKISALSGCEKGLPDYTKYVSAIDLCSPNVTITMQPEAGTILSGNGDTAKVTLYFDDNLGNVIDTTFTVTLNASECGTVGVTTNRKGTIQVYPNPVRSSITIELNNVADKMVDVEIYNLAGEKLMVKSTAEDMINWNLDQLVSGVYVLKVVGETTRFHQCIVKM